MLVVTTSPIVQRYYCKQCERHWTAGGTLRKVEAGAGRRNPRKKPAQRGKGSRSRSKATPFKSAGSECGDESAPADPSPEAAPQASPGAYSAEPPMTRAPPLRQQWPGKVGPAESTAGVGAAGVYSGAAPMPGSAAQRAPAHQVCTTVPHQHNGAVACMQLCCLQASRAAPCALVVQPHGGLL